MKQQLHCVYVLSQGGKVKIGISKDVPRRLRDLQTGNSEKIHLVFLIPFVRRIDAEYLEDHLHMLFESYRAQGEWFEIDRRAWYHLHTLAELTYAFALTCAPELGRVRRGSVGLGLEHLAILEANREKLQRRIRSPFRSLSSGLGN